jgi:glutamyl-tRNA synthetase
MNWLFARHHGGVFILRIEDTDRERSTPEATAAILSAMRWLGLDWDEGPQTGGPSGPYFQSERRASYAEAAGRLLAAGHAYRCYCTPEELEARRGEQLARGASPRYDGRCFELPESERLRVAAERGPGAVRLRMPPGETSWDDVTRDTVRFSHDELDDIVLLRSDGLPTYNFAAVVDDAAMRITHVIRGDDHISNTPRQIVIYGLLGIEPPRFAHVPMILGPDGSRLSKRHGATSVEAFRDEGFLPEAMVNFLALLGWAYDGKQELFDREDLVAKFDLDRVGKNPAIFNYEKLEWMNAVYLRRLSLDERTRLALAEIETAGLARPATAPVFYSRLVEAIGERLRRPSDVLVHGAFALRDEVTFEPEAWAMVVSEPKARDRLSAVAECLERLPEVSAAAAESAIRALAAEMGVKAGELIHPSRVALTGSRASLGIFDVMEILGKERAVARLRGAASRL